MLIALHVLALVACGGWSRRGKLYTGSGDAADDDAGGKRGFPTETKLVGRGIDVAAAPDRTSVVLDLECGQQIWTAAEVHDDVLAGDRSEPARSLLCPPR